jgi:hypothetical protein
MYWFGEPWPAAEYRAPVCADDEERVPAPLPGELCILCGEDFQPGARGVYMQNITAEGTSDMRYCHVECLMTNVGAM